MIKSREPRTKLPMWDGHASCFAESETPSGISFEMRSGTKRFVPLSFLSLVDFDGTSEILFRHPCGTITVKGKALEPLWNALCQGKLARVVEKFGGGAAATEGDAPAVLSIVIQDDDAMSS